MLRFARSLVVPTIIAALPSFALADIYQWEYVDPLDPSRGKRQSTILCPDGAGRSAAPSANLTAIDLTKAYFIGASLSSSNFEFSKLIDADFEGADLSGARLRSDATRANFTRAALTNANFSSTDLTGANLTDAIITHANFQAATSRGFSNAQFYSTASYKTGDLRGVSLSGTQLPSWNFAAKDLTGAELNGSNVTGATFAGGLLRSANFSNSTVTGTDFSGAVIGGANFYDTTARGLTPAQFYSTASYVSGDLAGVVLGGNDLTGWNLSGKNLAGAAFDYANLANADLTNSDLTNVSFTNARLAGANLAGATTHGFTRAQLFSTILGWAGTNLSSNDMAGWDFYNKYLPGANLSRSNLTGSDFTAAALENADLADAVLRGAKLASTTAEGFTAAQLYSTASYKSGDLSGVDLGGGNNLTGWNFAGKNLPNSRFAQSTLANSDFTGANLARSDLTAANLSGATLLSADLTDAVIADADFSNTTARGLTPQQFYSTANYKSGSLANVRLSQNSLAGWNFAGKNLTGARFVQSNLTGANFTDAIVSRALFNQTTALGFSPAQLYSTAGYKARDLSGIFLVGNDFTGWNFGGQNLSNANLSQTVFNNADVTNARFTGAALTSARFWGADARGAIDLLTNNPGNPSVNNLIRPDGSIQGLSFSTGNRLITIRDYDGDPSRGIGPIPIVISSFARFGSGTISMVFDADAWDSRISFAENIQVDLNNGTLQLGFAPGVDVATQHGRNFQLFSWFAVAPTGHFTVSSPHHWDTSRLHTTGQVRLLPSVPGDIDLDGIVGIADYFTIGRARATRLAGGWASGDFNYSGGPPNAEDYLLMDRSFLAQRAAGPASPAHPTPVPEPTALTALPLALLATRRRRPC